MGTTRDAMGNLRLWVFQQVGGRREERVMALGVWARGPGSKFKPNRQPPTLMEVLLRKKTHSRPSGCKLQTGLRVVRVHLL
jgi:hypothetical protein